MQVIHLNTECMHFLHLAQLHQDAHHPNHAPLVHGLPSRRPGHELLVQEHLPSAELALDNMLELGGQLCLHVLLQPTQDERPDDAVQTIDKVVVPTRVALDDAVHGVRKPVREFFPVTEDVRHEKMEQRPELHQVVL